MLKAHSVMAKEKRDAMIGAMVPSAIKAELQAIADPVARSRKQRLPRTKAGRVLSVGHR